MNQIKKQSKHFVHLPNIQVIFHVCVLTDVEYSSMDHLFFVMSCCEDTLISEWYCVVQRNTLNNTTKAYFIYYFIYIWHLYIVTLMPWYLVVVIHVLHVISSSLSYNIVQFQNTQMWFHGLVWTFLDVLMK